MPAHPIAAAACEANDSACNQNVNIASNFRARGDAALQPNAKGLDLVPRHRHPVARPTLRAPLPA